MAQKTSGLRAILSLPTVYEGFQRALGSERLRTTLVARHIRPVPGQRMLDIGCGPGDVLACLPAGVDYVGFDLSESYISAARERYGDRGRFFVGDVGMVELESLGEFDRVLAMGVLHHLSDDEVLRLFRIASAVLRDGGTVTTIDPCFAVGQSRVARYVVSRDRGQNVRSSEEYGALAREWFGDVVVHEFHDLLRIPYTHAVLECRQPRPVMESR